MSLSRSQKIGIAFMLLAFAGIKTASLIWWQKNHAGNKPVRLECAVSGAGCVLADGVRFSLQGVDTAKTPFTVTAENVPLHVRRISVSFSMEHMDMGFNRYDLKPQANGKWSAEKIYLPVCVSNQHDWLVSWQIDNQIYQAVFHTRP